MPDTRSDTGRNGAVSTIRRRALPAAVGLVALALAGCVEERRVVGPPVDQAFSPQTIANSIFSLRFAAVNESVVQVGLITDALGLTTPGFNQAPRRLERGAALKGSLAPAFRPGAIAGIVANRAARRARGESVPLFPINFLGRTFVYDAGLDTYVSDVEGGPANGVRFILYTLDPELLLPSLPLFPIGFVDLIDQSNATSTRLRVRAFDTTGGGTVPIADYFVDGAFGSGSAGVIVSLLSEGFVVDRDGRFDFELDELLETDESRDVTIVSLLHRVISDEGSNTRLSVEGEITNDGSHSDLDFEWDIDGVGGSTRVDLRVVDEFQDGTIRHDGRLETTVTGSVELPDYIPESGGAYTLPEIQALDEILFGIDDVLIMADELFRPLGEMFGVR